MTYDDHPRCDPPQASPPQECLRLPLRPALPPLLPAVAGPWTLCLPSRPVPAAAADPAWLVFLGVPAPGPAPPADPWPDFLKP